MKEDNYEQEKLKKGCVESTYLKKDTKKMKSLKSLKRETCSKDTAEKKIIVNRKNLKKGNAEMERFKEGQF